MKPCEARMTRPIATLAAALTAALATGLMSLPPPVMAQGASTYPSRPVRFILPYAPGGAAETVTRLVAEQLSASLKQPFLIENRPGGGTVIGAMATVQAPADGHTVFVNASSYLINAHLMRALPYDTWADLLPLSLAAENPHVLVASNGTGWRTWADFIGVARSRGSAYSYASFGNGSSGHLAFEMLKRTYGFDMVHVPYKSTPQAMTDVMGGAVHAMLTDMPAAVQQVRAGRIMALAIAAEQRSGMLPEVPTFAEASSGTRFVSRSWWGFMVRNGTPAEIAHTLETEIGRALHRPEVRSRLADLGITAIGSSAAEFATFMRTEHARFGEAIRVSGATLD